MRFQIGPECLIVALVFTGCVPPDDGAAASSEKAKPAKPASAAQENGKPGRTGLVDPKAPTYQVEKGPFKVEASLKGVFESPDMTEVAVRTEAWAPNPLIVMKVVPHGTAVKKGDTLIELDLEKISQAIKDLETDRRLAELALKQAEEELPILDKTTPLDLAQAERAAKQADEDLKKFLESDRPLAERTVVFAVKNATNSLEYVQEELRQLEKMYRDKDMREETEEIILKRQRNQVESAKFFLETATRRRDDTLGVTLPRQEQTLRDAAAKQAVALEKAQATLPLTLSQKRLALEKLKYDADKAADRWAKLKRDRNAMVVTAPADGLVYYGKCLRGQWTTAAAVGAKLVRGGVLQPEEVVLTVVNPKSLFVRANVDEKDLANVRAGQKARVAATASPDVKLSGKVDQVSAVPITPGTFETRLALDPLPTASQLTPGMACTVQLVPYRKSDAVTVPATAVFADDVDDDKHFVYLARKEGKPEKRSVMVGKTSAGKTEVTEGLQEGDEILLEKPHAAKKPGASGPAALLGNP
jgi:multidrug resistance efflux pump